jgi:hypothetical protein
LFVGTEHVLTLPKKNRPQQHLFLVLVDAWWTEESGLDLPDCWSLAPVFYSQLKSKVGNILAKAAALRIDLDRWRAYSFKITHSPSHSQPSRLFSSSLSFFICHNKPSVQLRVDCGLVTRHTQDLNDEGDTPMA